MFGKRKYDRKKGGRKSFRRRIRRKGVVLKPPEPESVPEKPVFNASGPSLYSWMHVPPLAQDHYEDTNKITRGRFTSSLKKKCAEIVGANADAISASYLEEGSWSCWRNVWLTILKNGADSPELFRMFAKKFGDHMAFPCHSTINSDLNNVHSSLKELRNTALNACLIPFFKKHRVENIFSNVSIRDFATFVAGLKSASVVIDCSKMPSFLTSEVLAICNIPTLTGLDLSGNRQVDDQLLYTLASRLTSRSSNLRVLVLSGCPHITEKGVVDLLTKSDSSSLVYVETDIRLFSSSRFQLMFAEGNTSERKSIVTGTKWRFVQEDDKIGTACKYKLGLKYHLLSRNIDQLAPSKMLWDLKFFSSVLHPSDKHAEDLFCSTWKQRYIGAINRPLDPPYMYIKDPNIIFTPAETQAEDIQVSPIFERAGHDSSSESKNLERKNVKKPKRINTNAQAFFFGS